MSNDPARHKLDDLKAEWLKQPKHRTITLDPICFPGWEKLKPGDHLEVDGEWLTVRSTSDNWVTASRSPRVRIEFEELEIT